MHNGYEAISAKLKAMHALRLTEEDYDKLLMKRTVNEICGYLKNSNPYGRVLEAVDDRTIHRGNLERILNEAVYQQYMRLYRFMNKEQRDILKFWLMRKEMDYLKEKLRFVLNREEREDHRNYDDFFRKHTELDLDGLEKARDFTAFVQCCQGTIYYKILKTAEKLKSDFFSIGMMLDRAYYMLLWRAASKLDQSERPVFEQLVGAKIDLLNIMWIYRGKKYFGFKNEIIYTYLIPVHYRLTPEDIKGMVECEDAQRIPLMIKKAGYARLFENVDGDFFIEENERLMEKLRAKRIFVNYPKTMAAVFAYLSLKEFETHNIIMITEGVRYNLDPNRLRDHIKRDSFQEGM